MHKLLQIIGAWFSLLRSIETLCLRHYWIGRLGRAGSGITIGRDFRAYHPGNMEVGDHVSIANQVTLRALTSYPWSCPPQTFTSRLTIDSGSFINNGCQISCANRVAIGKNVMIAEHCYLADHNHDYQNADVSIKEQPLAVGGEMVIGDDTWMGANCCVSGAVTIGRHCVIGANSVVTTHIPDFSVAVGAPARVVKTYDSSLRQWVPVKS